MHQLAGRLFAIVERLENRLEELAKRVSSDGVLHATAGDRPMDATPAWSNVEKAPEVGHVTKSELSDITKAKAVQGVSHGHTGMQQTQRQQASSSAKRRGELPSSTVGGMKKSLGPTAQEGGQDHDDGQSVFVSQTSPVDKADDLAILESPREGPGSKGSSKLARRAIHQAKAASAPRDLKKTEDESGSEGETWDSLAEKEVPMKVNNAQEHAQDGDEGDPAAGTIQPFEAQDRLLELDAKFVRLEKKLDLMAGSMGLQFPTCEGDDDDDRKRIKEKLKLAIEADRRSRFRTIVSRSEVWLEYIFGICRPDQRLGKQGSRLFNTFERYMAMSQRHGYEPALS
jgi:hypothetical protein